VDAYAGICDVGWCIPNN